MHQNGFVLFFGILILGGDPMKACFHHGIKSKNIIYLDFISHICNFAILIFFSRIARKVRVMRYKLAIARKKNRIASFYLAILT